MKMAMKATTNTSVTTTTFITETENKGYPDIYNNNNNNNNNNNSNTAITVQPYLWYSWKWSSTAFLKRTSFLYLKQRSFSRGKLIQTREEEK